MIRTVRLVFAAAALTGLLLAPVAFAQDDDGGDDDGGDDAVMAAAIGCVATYDLVLARGLAGSHVAAVQKSRAQAREIYKEAAGLDDDAADAAHEHEAAFVIGADGAGSALRAAMNAHRPLGERIEELGHGYKELEIPALADFPPASLPPAAAAALARGERFAIEPNALHIWPRGNYMCIALPNAEGSFTVTLFLPARGDPSFVTVSSPAQARALFAREFADASPLIPDLERDFAANPVGVLATLYLDRWHLDGRALLVGDAAHAIVPFHGQGMNCGFEDAVELAELLAQHGDDLAWTFAEFERRRRPNAEAIAAMALENYVEMRDSVADAGFLLRRELGRLLAARHPQRFMPRYSMVTFTRMPYAQAFARGAVQDAILREAASGRQRIHDVDLAAADASVLARLTPL